MDKYDSIIYTLNDDEIRIMEILGSLEASKGKNVNLHSLTKRIHPKYEINLKKTLKELKNKGLLGKYRKENICLSREGAVIANRLYDKKLEKLYPDLNILLLF